MKRTVLALALAALTSAALVVPACNSSSAGAGSDAGGGDATIGPGQLEGAPCDPTLSNPCLQVPCNDVACDPAQLICVATPLAGPCVTTPQDASFVFDSSGEDVTVVAPAGCASNADCPPIPSFHEGGAPVEQVCAYSAFDGCSSSGVCVIPAPPHTQDGAVQTACGCDDQPVPYVTDYDTASPVQSPTPCVAPDSGGPTGEDAAADAPVDAPTDAPVDAAADALSDAPSDAADGGD